MPQTDKIFCEGIPCVIVIDIYIVEFKIRTEKIYTNYSFAKFLNFREQFLFNLPRNKDTCAGRGKFYIVVLCKRVSACKRV